MRMDNDKYMYKN